jgi:hypothetical protein
VREQIDLKASDTASEWWHEHYCNHCKSKTGHEEFMTNICLSCGTYSERNCWEDRASRRYYNGSEWVIQHRYKNGSFGYSEYSPISGGADPVLYLVAGIVMIIFFAAILSA